MGKRNLPDKLAIFDTETTGTNVENDRILTCYLEIQSKGGETLEAHSWTINPGVEVPAGAAAVHGMSTEWIRQHGRSDVNVAIEEICQKLEHTASAGIPIVAYNLRFDMSILNNERKRHMGISLSALLESGTFYDPLVHDKARDKYRKGNRKLQTVCEFWGIEFNEDDAHEAKYDVQKTGELAWHHLAYDKASVAELYALMPGWMEEQNSSLQAYFNKSGKLNDDDSPIIIDRGWPIITKGDSW